MKCVIYTRVSSKEQETEGFSIPAQQKLLKEYAAQNRMEIVREFTDVETAKAAGRAQFGAMVEFFRSAPDVRHLLVEKTDRLYRNFRDYVLLEDLRLELHLVKENEVLGQNSRSHAKMVHGLKVVLAKNYIDNLSEEVKKGLKEKVEQGEWPHRAPLGYRNDPLTRRLVLDEDRAPVIKELFEAYASGVHSISSLRSLARDLGLAYRGSGKAISRSCVEKMLRNPIYTGQFLWKGSLHRGTHASIVSQRTFDRVQAVISNASKPKLNGKEFAFRGLLTCGHCGCAITAEIKKGKYIYYRCTNGRGKCSQPYIPEPKLAAMFGQVLRAIQISTDEAEEIRIALKDSFDMEQQFRKKESRRLKTEYDHIQAHIDHCYRDKLDGTIDAGFWQATHERLTAQQNQVGLRLSRLEDASRNYYQEGVTILELAQSACSLYEKAQPKDQATLLRSILSNCVIEGVSLYPAYREPFNLFVEAPRSELWRRR